MSDQYDDPGPTKQPGPWTQNHGNLLVGLCLLVVALGAGLIAYQQANSKPTESSSGIEIVRPDENGDESDDQNEGPSIEIRAIGAANSQGHMMVAIYDTANEFNEPTKAILKAPKEIEDGVASWKVTLDSLPASFAIAAYHDENNDERLNRNTYGIPTERYGFSNNARGVFGPPSFVQAVIKRPTKEEVIEIFIR